MSIVATFSLALAVTLAEAPPPVEAPSSSRPVAASPSGRVGVGLVAGGAALATATAVGVTLAEALARPDDPDRAPDPGALVEIGGFATVALASASVALLLVGGALVLRDEAETASP
jgi:hypothetical protein